MSTDYSTYSGSSLLSPSASSKYLTRGRFEVPSLMPRVSSRSEVKSPYTSRTSRSASGPRAGMSSGSSGRYGSSYGSSSTGGTGSSGYSSNYSSGTYTSPSSRSSTTSNYYGGSSALPASSLYTPTSSSPYTSTSSSYSSSYVPSHRSSYLSSSSGLGASSTSGVTSPRAKSPVKEKEAKSEETTTPGSTTDSTSNDSTTEPYSWRRRTRHRTASTSEVEPTTEVRMPSLNESATTMSKDLRECLREEFLLCKICFDVFKTPKSLPCLHTFCLECLNKYMEGQRLDHRKFACPICRRQVYMPQEGALGFPDSFFVERLHDVLSRRTDDTNCHICNFRGKSCQAHVFCLECKTNLCNDCGTGHRESKVTSKHSMLTLDDDSTTSSKARQHCCPTHSGEPVCFFCVECRRPICLACTVIDHAGHSVEAIQSVRQEFITECQGYLAKAEHELTDLTSKRTRLSQVEREVVDKKDAVKSEVCAVADALIEQINKQKAAIMTELDQMFDFDVIESERRRMDTTIGHLQAAVEAGQAVLSKDLEPIEQLKAKGQVLSDLDEALHFQPYNVEVFSDRSSLAVQFLSGESEVRLGRLVRTVLPSDGSGNGDPIIEYRAATEGNEAILTTGAPQTFVPKDDIRKQLRSIDSLALLPTGELVVLSATSERRVQIFDMAGMLKAYFPQRSNKLAQPTALCVWDNQIAVTDAATKSVHVYDTQGRLSHVFGAGILDRPWAITATTNGNYVIADPGKTRLTIHTNQGELLNVVHFQKKQSVPRFLATCGNTIYSVGLFGDDIRAWRFANATLRLLGVIKVASAAGNGLLASTTGLGSASGSMSSVLPKQQEPIKATSSVSSEMMDEAQRSRSGSVSVASAAGFACAGLFADKEGNLFVTDRSTSSVAVFTALSETYMIQLSPSSPSRPSSIVVTPDDRIIVAQSRVDETISGLVESLTGEAVNMELVSYSLC